MTLQLQRLALFTLAGAALLILAGCGSVQTLKVDSPLPADFPSAGFSHKAFEQLLQQFVRDGNVDYGAWHADAAAMQKFNSYIAALAAYSPENAPQRFTEPGDKKAFWLYAYNALVIKAVLDRWPLDSVTDVRAPLEFVKGYGFFYQLQFVVGGKTYNLYDIEHDKVLAGWSDPRAHFVLNCASSSCPVIRPELPTGPDLEPFLDEATKKFISNPKNVEIDHAKKEVRLSKIFQWYESDFINDLRRRSLPSSNGIIDYLIAVAPEAMKSDLHSATDYTIKYNAYNWGINRAPKSSPL